MNVSKKQAAASELRKAGQAFADAHDRAREAGFHVSLPGRVDDFRRLEISETDAAAVEQDTSLTATTVIGRVDKVEGEK